MSTVRLVRRSRRLASIVAVLLLAALVGREHHTRAQAFATSKLTTVLAAAAGAVAQETPGSVPLARPAAVNAALLPKAVQDALKTQAIRVDAAGAVQVYVLMNDVSMDSLQALANAGATIQIPDAPNFRVQATIPFSRLTAVASLPAVNFIRLPNYAIRRRTGSVTTEGDSILHADAARAAFNLDGTGVKVGVISDGLKGVFATGSCGSNCAGLAGGPISTGDLPTATGTRNGSGKLTASAGGIVGQSFQSNGDLEGIIQGCAFAGAGAEGTALLEIVHDLAPAASLAFANADTDVAFNQAVNSLASGNDIVVDDLGFFIPPFDGTNTVSANTAAALNNNSNHIRAYITANGNDADEHYYGAYVDSGVDGTTIPNVPAGHLHLFQSSATTTDVLSLGPKPYEVFAMPAGGTVHIFLVWDDPAGKSTNNYDLYLVRESSGQVVALSTDRQAGSSDPVEEIDYTNNGADDKFHIVVQNVGNAAQAKNLNIIAFQGECDASGPTLLAAGRHERLNFNTATTSVTTESDAGGTPVSVISVGAICSASAASASATNGQAPDESCRDASHATAEFFSSRGPTVDGRVKPDISAVDGVSITGAGSFEVPFFGTSAAAPHIAGEAALLMQASACISSSATFGLDAPTARAKLRGLIVNNADARSASPPDNVFGAGLANVNKAVQASLPTFGGQPNVVVNANVVSGSRLSPSALGFTDPSGCPLQRLSWSGGCGTSPDSAMTCPLGTTAVSVGASSGGPAFSAPTPLQVTVTSFAIGSSPASATVTAGQPAHYQLSVTPQAGPFTGTVALGCGGLPQGATCVFSPATVTPGAATATVGLTISTTARSQAFTLPTFPMPSSAAPMAFVVLSIIGAGVIGRRVSRGAGSPRRLTVAALGAVVAAFALQIACGSKNNNGTSTTISLDPTSLTFKSQSTGTTAPPQAVTLTNTGQAVLTINGIGATGDFSQSNTCGSSLPAGASCVITVTFTPTTSGSRTGTLSITDSASGSPQHISLTGTGTSSNGATPAGSFAVSINGVSGTFVSTGTVTLTVQ